MTNNTTLRFDPLDPVNLISPYAAYRNLQETDPIHWGAADDAGLPGRWYVVRYADVMTVLRDARFGREIGRYVPQPPPLPADRLLHQVAEGWMILRDPPDHTRLRSLVSPLYTPRRIQQLRGEIDTAAHALIDDLRATGPGCDFLTVFALPLTVHMTACMLGLPVADRTLHTDWSRALAAAIDLNQEEGVRSRIRAAVADCTAYVREVIAARRRVPQEDVISALVATEADDTLVVGSVTHLLFVGNDPVMHMLGNVLITLAAHPHARAWLAANPHAIEAALDELMRYDSPVQMTFRYALTDVELHGKQLRTGDHVAVVLGAANRDPAYYADPDRLDLTRPVGTPAHFGMGIHYCLGAPLARLEGQIALRALMAELPELRPAQPLDELAWQRTVAVRGVETLPVLF